MTQEQYKRCLFAMLYGATDPVIAKSIGISLTEARDTREDLLISLDPNTQQYKAIAAGKEASL